MKTPKSAKPATVVVLAIAEIKAAVAAFDRGEANAVDVLEAVRAAVTAPASSASVRSCTARPRRRAA